MGFDKSQTVGDLSATGLAAKWANVFNKFRISSEVFGAVSG